MNSHVEARFTNRYETVTDEKSSGATYTPKLLADFVARQILEAAKQILNKKVIRVLDPAVGDGELLINLLRHLDTSMHIEVFGFDTNKVALEAAQERLSRLFPNVALELRQEDFLNYVLAHFEVAGALPMFASSIPGSFDLIIANPPYVRTQILGAHQARVVAQQFGLNGRTDLYHAFLIAMAAVLEPDGVAGIIVSNRFMTTKSGAAVRAALREKLNLSHVWDLGDTKLFDAAVLPAVLLAQGKSGLVFEAPSFTSIYETTEPIDSEANDPIAALSSMGVIGIPNGRRYVVKHGKLDVSDGLNSVWRISTEASDRWLTKVVANTWGTFRDIGKIRVGVKTCADKIFIRSDWESLPVSEQPELLRPLTTHHVARRFKALEANNQQILYPHEMADGSRQTVDIDLYPRACAYLERYRAVLESRKYVIEAGRKWFEIWVPQDPSAWNVPKLVFRDISEKPIFWIDQHQTVVNGDCYWMAAERHGTQDLLWLAAAVANSTFAEAFYDHRFHNKLYSGRRRFMSQYVEQFPLPNPSSQLSQQIIETAKAIYDNVGTPKADNLEDTLNLLVWRAFGFSVEEIRR